MHLPLTPVPPTINCSATTQESDLAEHPAAQAWRTAQPYRPGPISVACLKQRTKSAIYRLRGAGCQGLDVIAKRCFTETALTERLIYQEVLPALPLPALQCYGCVPDKAQREFHWLFLEDAGNIGYEPDQPGHQAAATSWLVQLHTLAAGSQATAGLPDRGLRYYFSQLRLAQEQIAKSYSNPELRGPDLEAVKTLERQCSFVESRWERVLEMCKDMPRTLVHGDIKGNNVRIRNGANGTEFLPFDWELAGYGVPATDLLKCPDLNRYGAQARGTWPSLTDEQIWRSAQVGKLLRALVTIYWNSLKLRFPWVESVVVKLRLPQTALAEAIQTLEIK